MVNDGKASGGINQLRITNEKLRITNDQLRMVECLRRYDEGLGK
jgi:hypothetical protein